MTVTAVRKDPQTLTMTLDAEFEAPPERVWQLWADPRQLERWWGPPTYPATVTVARPARRRPRRVPHDRPGGRPAAGLSGRSSRPSRRSRLVFRDGFANADGTPNTDMPLNEARVTITEIGGGRTRMSIESTFPDVAAMEQLLAMGMEAGPDRGRRPDRRDPRRGARRPGLIRPRPTPDREPREESSHDHRPRLDPDHADARRPGRHAHLRRPPRTTPPPSRSCSSSARRWAPQASARWPATSPTARS